MVMAASGDYMRSNFVSTTSFQYVPDSTDSFRTSKKVCKQIENGVTAIFGKHEPKAQRSQAISFYDKLNISIRKSVAEILDVKL